MKSNYIILFVFLICSFSFSQEKDDLFNMIEQEEKKIDKIIPVNAKNKIIINLNLINLYLESRNQFII